MTPNTQLLHPVLGRAVKDSATDTCSRCGHTIPDEHVPLILWDNSGTLMWVYCETCEGAILPKVVRVENGCGNG